MMLGLDMSKFTRMESRFVDLLMDGRVHSFDEIVEVCYDNEPLISKATIKNHIKSVRRKISDKGLIISFVIANGRRKRDRGYQMSRRLHQDC